MTALTIACLPSLSRAELRVVVHPVAVDTETAAQILGVSASQVRAWVRDGRMTARYSGTKPIFVVEELREFAENGMPGEGATRDAVVVESAWFTVEPWAVDGPTAAVICGLSYSQFRKHVRIGEVEPNFAESNPRFLVTELRRFVRGLPTVSVPRF